MLRFNLTAVLFLSGICGFAGCGQQAETPAEKPVSPTLVSPTPGTPKSAPPRPVAADQSSEKIKPNEQLKEFFAQLDKLGRGQVDKAKYVTLSFADVEMGERSWQQTAWLIEENADKVTALQDDLIPWTYHKKEPTVVPSSWRPRSIKLESVTDVDFEAECEKLAKPREKADKEEWPDLRAAGPSKRFLIAHAAWKNGLAKYCDAIIAADLETAGDFQTYRKQVLDDLAWLHFLRGVNLLMYADRKEVVRHLNLAQELAPESEHAIQAKELTEQIEKLLATKPAKDQDESKLTEAERADFFISQLKDLSCPQMSQPGSIIPYLTIVDGWPDQNPPSAKLRDLGLVAVPSLIQALDDKTPTRTVYHWRDFARNRLVWRVSDFSWHILRDISKREFGYRPVVGFTFSSLKSEEQKQVIGDIKKWYSTSKDLSPDDQMFASFSSSEPKDWLAAGEYFLKRKDKRAVQPLIEKIKVGGSFQTGDLCELVSKFGDASAKDALKEVLEKGEEASDRLSAAIGLWNLGDESGIPLAIEFATAEEQAYGSWDEPVWFLMRTRSEAGMEALKTVVAKPSGNRAGEVISFITASISGDLWGERREPAGSVQISSVLIAALDRAEYTGGTINDIKIRTKDSAAKGLALLREGTNEEFGGRFVEIDPNVFNELEPDEAKRDQQIKALKEWYKANQGRLEWDTKKRRLVISDKPIQ